MLADRREKLHSEALYIFVKPFFYIDLCKYRSSVHLQEDFPNISE